MAAVRRLARRSNMERRRDGPRCDRLLTAQPPSLAPRARRWFMSSSLARGIVSISSCGGDVFLGRCGTSRRAACMSKIALAALRVVNFPEGSPSDRPRAFVALCAICARSRCTRGQSFRWDAPCPCSPRIRGGARRAGGREHGRSVLVHAKLGDRCALPRIQSSVRIEPPARDVFAAQAARLRPSAIPAARRG